jgi:hypothetical protein
MLLLTDISAMDGGHPAYEGGGIPGERGMPLKTWKGPGLSRRGSRVRFSGLRDPEQIAIKFHGFSTC